MALSCSDKMAAKHLISRQVSIVGPQAIRLSDLKSSHGSITDHLTLGQLLTIKELNTSGFRMVTVFHNQISLSQVCRFKKEHITVPSRIYVRLGGVVLGRGGRKSSEFLSSSEEAQIFSCVS